MQLQLERRCDLFSVFNQIIASISALYSFSCLLDFVKRFDSRYRLSRGKPSRVTAFVVPK